MTRYYDLDIRPEELAVYEEKVLKKNLYIPGQA
jgi:hypothetical protein